MLMHNEQTAMFCGHILIANSTSIVGAHLVHWTTQIQDALNLYEYVTTLKRTAVRYMLYAYYIYTKTHCDF